MTIIEDNSYNLSTYLTRVVDGKTRYLKVEFLKTLFDDIFLVEKVYGSIKNSKPTGKKKNIFYNKEEAIKHFKRYIEMKIDKGYSYLDTYACK